MLGFAHMSGSDSGPFVFMKRSGSVEVAVTARTNSPALTLHCFVEGRRCVLATVCGTAACDVVCSSRHVPVFQKNLVRYQYFAGGGSRFL